MFLALIISVLLFAAMWICGRAALVAAGITTEHSQIKGPYAFAVGLAIYSAMLFALCLIKAYTPVGTLIGTMLVVAGSLAVMKGRLAPELKDAFSGFSPKGLLTAGFIFLVTLPGLLLSVLPPFYKDTLIYHLYIPKLMLKTWTFVDVPGLSNTNFPLGMELVYGVGLMAGRPEVSRITHYLFFWLLLFTAYKIAGRFGKYAGFAAAAIIASTPSMQIVATWAYIDIALAFVTLVVIDAICDEKIRSNTKGLMLIGVLIGYALWMKFLSLYLAGYCMVLLLIALYKKGENAAPILGKVLVAGGTAGLFASPWYIKNIIQTGNPVYPYFTNIFGGKLQWDEALGQEYFRLLSSYGYGEGILKYLLAPYYMVRHGCLERLPHEVQYIGYDGIIGWVYLPLFIIAGASLVMIPRRPVLNRIFALAIFFGYFLWLTNSQQMRFLLPTIALMPVLGVAEIREYFKSEKQQIIAALSLVAIALLGLGSVANYFSKIKPMAYISGNESRHDFLMRVDELHPTYTYINENLPPDAYIFLVWAKNKRYYLDRRAYSDSIFEHFTLQKAIRERKSPQGLADWMREQGFTHMMFDKQYIQRGLSDAEMIVLMGFIKDFARPIFIDGHFALIEAVP